MAEDKSTYQTVVKWFGFAAAILQIIIGIMRLVTSDAQIQWPSDEFRFIDDVNAVLWRDPLFSFRPSVFCDAWTPLVMGLVGLILHFKDFKCNLIGQNMARYALWNFLAAMFGGIGYAGGFGIIFSIPLFITCILAGVCFFIADCPVSLELDFGGHLDKVKQLDQA